MQNDNLKFKNKKYIILFSVRSVKSLFFLGVFCFLFSCFFVSAPGVMAAIDTSECNASNYNCYGLKETLEAPDKDDGSAKLKDILKDENLATHIGTLVGALLAFIGVLFFILMIYGGFLWMTAQGDEQQVEKAKNLIIAAVIGLIIVMAAYAITAYIGGTMTGSA